VSNDKDPYSIEMERIVFAEYSIFKQWILLPIISLATALLIPIFMYWYPYCHVWFRFGKCYNKKNEPCDVKEVRSKIM
jgi:hypothetical protein